MIARALCVLLISAMAAPALAQGTILADDFTEAVAVVALPDGEAIVGERSGQLWRVHPTFGKRRMRGGPRVFTDGPEGLLDIALPASPGRVSEIFFAYAKPRGMGGTVTALARGTLSLGDDGVFSVSDVFTQRRVVDRAARHGGRIALTPDALWAAFGDRGDMVERTDTATAIGSVLRLRADGLPSVGGTLATLPSISRDGTWSYGLADPRAMIADATGRAFVLEPRGEEMVLLAATAATNLAEAPALVTWPGEDMIATGVADGRGGMVIAGRDMIERIALVSGRVVARSQVAGPTRPVDIAVDGDGAALVLTGTTLHRIPLD